MLIFDLCSICSLYLLSEQESSDSNMMFVIIKPWLKFTEAESLGTFFLSDFSIAVENTIQLVLEELFQNTVADKTY